MTRKLTIIAALLLLGACHHTNPEPVTPPEPETYKLTLGASMEDLTKAGVGRKYFCDLQRGCPRRTYFRRQGCISLVGRGLECIVR